MHLSFHMLLLTTLAIFLALVECQSQTVLTCQAPTVTLKNGSYVGSYKQNYHQDYFLGIPYAQPPVGDLRFRVPVPLNETWSDVRNATAYSPECVGYGGDDIGYESSEDCLTLNVIRPSGMEGQSLPVAFWIHGGGYVMGGSADRRYNLSFIVANSVTIGKPIIGVSINYRLSGWGFLYSDEIEAEGSTNVGMRDQYLALRWVQENIAAFGGDPTKVTIWGESAGAGSVGILVTAYGGRDDHLFRGVIGESGGPLLLGGSGTFAYSRLVYNNITRDAGCANVTSPLACLRALPFSTLNQAFNVTPSYSFNPRPDGDIIKGSQYEQLINGEFIKVPYLIGTNSDEGASFAKRGVNTDQDFTRYLIGTGVPANDTETLATLSTLYPDIPALGIPATMPSRPNSTTGIQFKRTAAYAGDYTFIAGRRLTNTQWAAYNTTSYAYRFNTIVGAGFSPDFYGIGHFVEVAFVFNNVIGAGYAINEFEGKPASYYRLSKLMSNMWVSFIHDGDPNGHGIEGTPVWPKYNPGSLGEGTAQGIVFDANYTAVSFIEEDTYRGEGIAYLNKIWGSVYGL